MLRRLAILAFLAPLALVAACATRPQPTQPAAEVESAPRPVGPPVFDDVTAASGVDFSYRNGEDAANHFAILESLGGGAALIDFDGDGRLDIYLTGGGTYDGPDKKEIAGMPGKLYRNLGGFKFEDVTVKAGLASLAGGKLWFYSHGVAVADYNRDGWPDLLVTGWKAVALFKNVPVDPADAKKGRKFEDVTAATGLSDGITWATSVAFADLDGDGFPELYVCQYVNWSFENHPKCSHDGKIPDVCPPKNFEGLTHKLYRNEKGQRFVEVGAEAGLKTGGPNESKGLGVLIVDLDGDRKPDIYVANDTVDKYLYLNRSKDGRFAFDERGVVSNCARDDRGAANGSMGLDSGDPFRTGLPALWVTNYENELHSLYQHQGVPGKPYFSFKSMSAGIGAIGRKYVGWGTAFVDVDLDGWEDLFVSNGHAIRHPLGKESGRKQKPVLLLNARGSFEPATERIGSYSQGEHNARGVAIGDLDNDGRPDAVISHVNAPATVLRGIGGPDRHWVGFELAGDKHSCTVGTVLVFESKGGKQTRFAKGGGSYASAPDNRLLFGLGDDATGQLTVTWPDGRKQTFDNVKADRYYRVSPGFDTLLEPAPRKD